MKSVKSTSNAPEYAQLLSAFDKAQSAYEQAKAQEVAAKHQLKDADKKDVAKAEEEVLRLKLNHAKHIRKACKATVGIAKLAIKQWTKSNAINEVIEGVEAPAPKKRGRQPKPKEGLTVEAAAEAPAPKKRGRQPKSKEAVTVVAAAKVEVEEAPAPKKRGRQPKPKEALVEAAKEPTPPKRGRQLKPAKTIVEATEEPAPKKRGRQPKPVEEVTESAEPKRRGRPARIALLEEEGEGVAGASARAMLAAPVAKAVKAPKAEKAPKAPKAVKEPKAPKAEKVAKAPKAVKEPKAPKAEKVAKAPKAVKAPKAEKVAKAPKAVKAPKAEKAPVGDKRPRRSSEDVVAQKAAAEAAAKASFQGEDFRIVEGIGPKVTAILHANGIMTFKQLAEKSYDDLKALMLNNKQYLANPTNWARQSALAAEGKMAELEALKGQLKNGL
jgi:predicted flap endonuclease-1-like 5' DNA nuclease